MPKLVPLLAACSILTRVCLGVDAQTPTAKTPVFSSATDFVQVPVIVQRSGKHVGGLKKENFVLQQDGKDQPIASFEEINEGTIAKGSSGQVGDDFKAGQIPAQITIIAIDMVNTPNLDRAYFTQELQDYLSTLSRASGPIGLVAVERSGIRVLREFTTDPRSLLAAVQKQGTVQPTKNDDPGSTRQLLDQAIAESETQGFGNGAPGLISMTDALKLRTAEENMVRFQDRSAKIDSLLAIQQLAQALKGIPGRKTLVLVGSGFKFIDTVTTLRNIGAQGKGGVTLTSSISSPGESLDQAAYTWKVLNDANVAVYPIDTRRTVNTAFQSMDTANVNTPSILTHEENRQTDRDILDTFKAIAAETGGKPCFYRTDLGNCVREAVDDDRDYYLLGSYVDKSNSQPGWHKINVKLNEKATLRYRQGFIIAKFSPEAARKIDISLALNSPFPYTDLPFSGRFKSFSDRNGRKLAEFDLSIPPDAVTADESTGRVNFDVVAIARAEGGKEAAHLAQRIDRKFSPENIAEIKRIGIDYTNKLELAPGDYGVWFVVRDNLTGRTGSAVVPLKVPKS